MSYIINILKGIVIGIANAIPGVSGGTIAVTMGIYDKIIHAVNNLIKKFKESMKLLIPIGIGAVLGIVGLSFVIKFCFERFPLQTNLLFVGLILGGLPMMWGKVKGKKVGFGHIICFAVFFIAIVAFSLVKASGTATITTDFIGIIKLFSVGVIAAATMIIPGVSGSMILMLLGYYYPILGAVSGFVKAVLALNFNEAFGFMAILVPAGIGMIVGIVVLAKLIELAFKKIPEHTHWSIIGLIAASPIAILIINLPSVTVDLVSVLTGILTLAIGFITAKFLGEK